MAASTASRRTNAYAGECYVCFDPVAANEGWLYRDVRETKWKRFPRLVKCDRCHQHKFAHSWQVKQLNAPRAPRSWSTRDVARAPMEVVPSEWSSPGAKDVWITLGGEKHQVAFPDPVSGRQTHLSWTVEWDGLAGHPFSKAAFQALLDRINALVLAPAPAAWRGRFLT